MDRYLKCKNVTSRDCEYISAYLITHSQIKAAELCGVSRETVARALRRSDIQLDGRKNNGGRHPKITDAEILDAIAEGMTRQQIADKYGVHVENLAKRMKKLGVHATYALNYKQEPVFGSCWHYVKGRDLYVRESLPDFVYLETRRFENGVRYHRLKCKHCQAIIERCDLRTGVRCDCYEERKRKQAELDKRRADVVRLLRSIEEQKKPKICCQCGKEFHSPYETKVYCSEACVKRAKIKRKKERDPEKFREARRRASANASHGHHIHRAKKYGCEYIYGISLAKVIKKDNGICQICGEPVDKTDRTEICVGPKYPSIDHIIPLSKGGAHTWENVQLAHTYCNSVKRDLLTVKRKEA